MNRIQQVLMVATAGIVITALSACTAPNTNDRAELQPAPTNWSTTELPETSAYYASDETIPLTGEIVFDGKSYDVQFSVQLASNTGENLTASQMFAVLNGLESGLIPAPIFALTSDITRITNDWVAQQYVAKVPIEDLIDSESSYYGNNDLIYYEVAGYNFACASGVVELQNSEAISAAIQNMDIGASGVIEKTSYGIDLETALPCGFLYNDYDTQPNPDSDSNVVSGGYED